MNFSDGWHIQQSERENYGFFLLCPNITMIIISIASIIKSKGGGNELFWMKGHKWFVQSENNYFNWAFPEEGKGMEMNWMSILAHYLGRKLPNIYHHLPILKVLGQCTFPMTASKNVWGGSLSSFLSLSNSEFFLKLKFEHLRLSLLIFYIDLIRSLSVMGIFFHICPLLQKHLQLKSRKMLLGKFEGHFLYLSGETLR